MLKYERRTEPLLSRRKFARRMLRHGSAALGIIAGSLLIGMLGYHHLAELPWVDAFLNSAMLLGGMGPVSELHATSAKIFAGLYALYSGIIFLVLFATLLAPVFHRMLHRFHWQAGQARNGPG